jgi:anthranilate synthase/aminodeoxychorismate synthase-like glutamine amidotransferase
MLIVDNYDSFTYNIVQYIKMIGIEPIIIKNDEKTLAEIKKLKFSKIIISPGWGNPDNAGVSNDVLDYYQDKVPILGVCLGMQCIAKYFGAEIIKAPEPCHGKISQIYYDSNCKIFKKMPQGFSATRYHSLVVKVPQNSPIKIVAKTEDNLPMGLEIVDKNIYGVQFHPEAYLTDNGIQIFKNFCNEF